MEAHPALLNLFSFFFVAVIDSQATTVLIILLLSLLALSFAVSGCEVAFFSLTYKDINVLKTKQQHSYQRIVDLLENPKVLLASLLIANSFANIAIIIISNLVLDNLFQSQQLSSAGLEFAVKVITVMSLLVLFAEVLPKIYAGQNNIRFAKDFGIVAEAVFYLFSRIASGLVRYTDIIEKKLTNKKKGPYNLEELYQAIDITTANDESENEKNILKSIAKFGEITVKQIMKTRVDVSGVEYETEFGELIKKVEELHYSRLPVYKDSLDEIAGMVHTKDLLPYIDQSESFDWHTLMRPPYFIHEQKMIEDLLKEFQSKRIHFAVVVDEFGGTSGIVTLEDILEEIIGEIKDEFDDEDSSYKKIDDNTYIFEGKLMINDACKIMELPLNTFDLVKGESDSLAGLVLEIAGDIPVINQILTSGDFEFTVLEKTKNRLQKIKVTIKQLVKE